MFTLCISIAALVLGYIFYGRFVEKVFGINPSRSTPCMVRADGIDYVSMPTWKVFMIQFLNIAGTGPIFGAILGAEYGPSCYLWIVLGCIFGGAVHDFFSGMLSVRHEGIGLPEIIGIYLGNNIKKVMLIVCLLLLLLVGAVFVYSPALTLESISGGGSNMVLLWVFIILAYYILATLVPIDKIIGKIYPLFAFAILFMGASLLFCLISKWPSNIPEIWQGLQNRAPENGNIFPCLFITIACGAISGFHATQSPMMARCIRNEKDCRKVYYGSMITEGVIALVWATVSSYFFYGGGAEDMGITILASSPENGLAANEVLRGDAPKIVQIVSKKWLGTFGSILALLGVVAAPITSGDTALRSARMIISDAIHLKQEKIIDRLKISIPVFIIVGMLLWFNISHKEGFNILWRYFGWANQTLSVFTLWAITVYLTKQHKNSYHYMVTLLPACFMTTVCTTFICTAQIGLNIPQRYSLVIGVLALLICLFNFYSYKRINEL